MNNRLSFARQVNSPNYSERPSGTGIDLLVIHNISLPPGEFGGGHIDQLFTNCLDPAGHDYFAQISHLQVSSHLLIDRKGSVSQYVPFDRKAWHAGQSVFEGREQCNDFSIGIELEGTDFEPFTDAQYDQLICVTDLLTTSFPAITADRVVGHSDIAPGRKTDPGPCFDWSRYLPRCRFQTG